ncbi:OmpA family protein [Myxococcus stipitatus DSM 14675]|uniref:OmpA family protein n=1 Tax=Myxococcus stipitatus (strain DSM 14675 / JCM 12634 / Mx s8) TaxID=1278073 RepID=L7U9T0_MYXSD|nr:OmpA family protein [Myxococcus stipitatus]AGC44808.1 OmpA family protein [Myxococcus stipitatus DSM 14675]
MGFNLIDMVRERFTGNVMQQMGSALGEDPSTLTKALPGAIAAVGGSVVERGSTEAGAQRLMSQLNEGGYTGPDTGGEDSLSPDTVERGQGMLNGLFGDKLGMLSSVLGRTGGFSNSKSASGLLAVVAPMVMGVIGKQVRDHRMSPSGLSQLLGSQRSLLSAAMPAGLGSILGMGGTGPRVVEEVHETRTVPSVETVRRQQPIERAPVHAEPRKQNLSWVIPVALLALLAGWFLTRGKREAPRREQATATQPAQPARPEEPVRPAPDDTGVGGAGSMGTRAPAVVQDAQGMRQAIDNGANSFILGGVNFDEGSATLTPQSDASVGQLASVLREKPDARVRIAGHTDSTGDPAANRQLAQRRAEAVRSALVEDGIPASRVDVAAVGSEKPVADNDTTQGRDMNRRIEVQMLSR